MFPGAPRRQPLLSALCQRSCRWKVAARLHRDHREKLGSELPEARVAAVGDAIHRGEAVDSKPGPGQASELSRRPQWSAFHPCGEVHENTDFRKRRGPWSPC